MIDFYITSVRYSGDGASIEKVRIATRNEPITGKKSIGAESIVPAKFVRDLVRNGKLEIWTATIEKNKTGSTYRRGAKVLLYGDKFITTSPNRTERDNLDELPEF